MSFNSKNCFVYPVDERTRLAQALGFRQPTNTSVEPYLDYILKQYAGSATTEQYAELFIEVVEHFRSGASTNRAPTIQALLDKYSLQGFRNVFADTGPGDPTRKEHVEDTVMCICGTWAAMLSSFQHKSRSRKVVAAYSLFAAQLTPHGATPTTAATTQAMATVPYNETVSGLIAGSGLLPGGQWDYRISYENDAATKLAGLVFNAPSCSNQTHLQNILAPTCGQAQTSRMLSTLCSLERAS
jgi:hypothetical protein